MLDIARKNIVREKDGRLSLHLDFIETNPNTVIKTVTIQGNTADEIESELRPKIIAMKDNYLAQKALEAAADARIDALRIECGLPAGE